MDPEFGISIPEATEVVRQATALWQEATVQPLFVYDEAEGFPIRIVYDERQELNQARLRSQRALDQSEERLRASRAEMEARAARHDENVRALQQRVRAFEGRVAAHNAQVQEWNGRGGAPAGTRSELAAEGAALDRERQELASAGRSLDAEADAIREEQGRLAAQVAEHNRRLEDHTRAFPSAAVRSGEYREAVQRIGGQVAGISREIRIYRFADAQELRLIAAHELGHALGLGHVESATAVMNELHDSGVNPEGVSRLSPADAALLASRCPALVSEGR